MAEDTTSTNAQAANADSAQAATTQTASNAQAATDSEQITLEEARRLRSEAVNLRKREKEAQAALKVYQDAEQVAKDAQLPEIERLKKVAADLQAEHDQLAAELVTARVNQDVAKYAGKLNFIVSPDLLAKLIDWEAVEFDDAGKPTNVEKLLEKLAKNAPDLVKKEQQQQGAPPLPGMSPDRAAYGRSSIQRPGTPTPGQRPSWDDVPWKH